MRSYWLPVIKIDEYKYENRIWWYISKSRDSRKFMYLHKDGVWRVTTINELNKYTGYYNSRKEAEEMLAIFMDSH